MLIRNKSRHVCPVCGFLLRYPADDFNICPSCGVEFGKDDRNYSYEKLREAWLARGMQWTSQVSPKPKNYEPIEQLKNLDASAVGEMAVGQMVVGSNPSEFRLEKNSAGSFGTLRVSFA